MNKPSGYVCSAASDSHKTVYELLTPELQKLVSGAPRGSRLHTVGRLDCDTSGLLLLTNDGKFSNRITASAVVRPESMVVECPQSGCIETTGENEPSEGGGGFDTASGLLNHHITKTYRARLAVPVSAENQDFCISRAAAGLILPPEKKYGEQKALPASLIFEAPDVCKITVNEGKFHEVRRIFRALGNEVTELERISIGSLTLPQDLSVGQWREISEEEKSRLSGQAR